MSELIKIISEYPLSSLFLVIVIGLFLEWVKEMFELFLEIFELFLYHNQKNDNEDNNEEIK